MYCTSLYIRLCTGVQQGCVYCTPLYIKLCTSVHQVCVYYTVHLYILDYVQVYNKVVCNCHEDSSLLNIIELVEYLHSSVDSSSTHYYWQRLQVSAINLLIN